MTHDARTIANSLIELGVARQAARDPLQLIKLTYLCHGWMLGLYHRPLSTQPAEAWRYGPVIADVYHALKIYGRERVYTPLDYGVGKFDEFEHDLICQVFDVYYDFSGIELSQMTHARGSPWYQVWHSAGRNAVIPNDLIEKHFVDLAENND